MKTDDLEAFFVDENEPADTKLIAAIMQPFVNSIGRNGIIDFSERWDSLRAWEQILVYLVCRKAMFLKGVIPEESVGPKTVCTDLRISSGSAKDISRHNILKKIVKGEKGKYMVPNNKLKKVKEVLINSNDPEN